ncbi:hypothetical protein JL107_10705 [Nakamurella flavida]|uniref:Uncharacterized protein n=1 Tax=Nakamurella flavida TaxID=363630 RepID=A0A938YFV8_9ACTN|nr:hypothetical protein [Nakamurella flavida]MBM9476916.1 hypothetical protein [Nakamurella flavida]MDP9779861.1 hypothetical protein [Nakamurella flavida]
MVDDTGKDSQIWLGERPPTWQIVGSVVGGLLAFASIAWGIGHRHFAAATDTVFWLACLMLVLPILIPLPRLIRTWRKL